ncbi:hypothetical protein NM688_g6264 [Phlebia brevispora]|uniref:Uncharacterized protein n=1 Tax=Phlebia brevispora TaxID=194682 RepID=A0ACC1SI98_9APHY|nr:hypothetical protein NM688_g6264 [Phlebia brevispora]
MSSLNVGMARMMGPNSLISPAVDEPVTEAIPLETIQPHNQDVPARIAENSTEMAEGVVILSINELLETKGRSGGATLFRLTFPSAFHPTPNDLKTTAHPYAEKYLLWASVSEYGVTTSFKMQTYLSSGILHALVPQGTRISIMPNCIGGESVLKVCSSTPCLALGWLCSLSPLNTSVDKMFDHQSVDPVDSSISVSILVCRHACTCVDNSQCLGSPLMLRRQVNALVFCVSQILHNGSLHILFSL